MVESVRIWYLIGIVLYVGIWVVLIRSYSRVPLVRLVVILVIVQVCCYGRIFTLQSCVLTLDRRRTGLSLLDWYWVICTI